MKNRIVRTAGLWLSLILLVSLFPAKGWAEESDRSVETAEAAVSAASEDPVCSSESKAQLQSVGNITVDDAVEHGALTLEAEEGILYGTAIPEAGYDLATIRLLQSSEDTVGSYIPYEREGDVYTFTIEDPGSSAVLTAYFFNLERWDGAVDLTWYDPAETSFNISTPAQLAGVAAITNGMVDQNNTEEWMIKDNEGRIIGEDGSISHRYIATEPWGAFLLTPNTDAAVTDTVWRLPKHDPILSAEDDCYHDFRYRTVNITADIDMTDEDGQLNWTPIGGKYAMNPEEKIDGEAARVIDTRFQGVFDGNGHTITINCNRYAQMGFAYSWAVGVVGYLGGGVDYKNGYPKDTFIEYAEPWIPTARNLVVRGYVKGRRMAAGVVGRTGETNYGVVVEKCANYATVEATDMRGCAGIVAAAWGDTVIRQCYNAGRIKSAYSEHGGIVGSNGYEGSGSYEGRTDFRAEGADIYDCYNIGDTTRKDAASGEYRYDGHEIGMDGQAFAKYTVANSFYLSRPDAASLDQGKIGYCRGEGSANTRAKCRNVTAVEDMNSEDVLSALNQNGNVFVEDSDHVNSDINGGGPVLYFQTEAYRQAQSLPSAELTVSQAENGTVEASQTGAIPYGTTVELAATPASKHRFSSYQITDGGAEKTPQYGDFYTVTGQDVNIGALFEETGRVTLIFAEENAPHVHYYVVATKVYDADKNETCSELIHSEDTVAVGDRVKLVPHMKKTFINTDGEEEPVHPDLKTLEYTGEIGAISFEENALEKYGLALNKTYEVTGETAEINIEYALKTQGKRWTSTADTSWYKEGAKSFTVKTARQLAGVAVLCDEGITFKGVTITLGNDISLENTMQNSGDKYPSERSWIGIGTDQHPFEGTFEGNGHTIRYLTRNFYVGYCPGSNGGLFGVTDHAVIRNVTVEGGTYENTDVGDSAPAVLPCLFRNGARGGGIVGEAIESTITNCRCSLDMEDASMAGGIVGTAEGATAITNCSYTGMLSATKNTVGGIVGQIEGSGAKIDRCINQGQISSTSYHVGGIVGDAGTGTVSINRCRNESDITVTMKGTSGQQNGSAGGIIGYAGGALTCTESVNKGNIRGENHTFALGGIAGATAKATIRNCYNMGELFSNSSRTNAQIAGIANLNTANANQSSLINCYNAGRISTGESFTSSNKGGIAGYGKESTNTISNCYCSASSVAQIGGTTGIAGEVMADDNLRAAAKKLGDAYIPDVDNINTGYPIFMWQNVDSIGTASVTAVTKSADTTLMIKWKASGSSTGYQIAQATSATGKYTTAATVKSATARSYKKTGLVYGKTYYYKVRAYRTINGENYYSAWSAAKNYKLVPGKVTLTSASNKKTRTAVLKWKRVSGVTGYQIYRSTNANKGFKKIATVKKGTKVTYTDKRLKKGKKYFYKVRAYKTVKKNTGYGAYSAVKGVKIQR